MIDLISRAAALEALEKLFPMSPMKSNFTKGTTCGIALAEVCIKHLPEAKIERMTGEWRKREKCELFYCSACWKKRQNISGYYYCPNCGAFMAEDLLAFMGGDNE